MQEYGLNFRQSILVILCGLVAASASSTAVHGTTDKGGGVIEAAISLSRTSCVAPCAIHFDATGTTQSIFLDRVENSPGYNGDDYEKYISLEYDWDFGDPESGVWQAGARRGFNGQGDDPASRNIDNGFVAAHVYETPGTYVATLTVTHGDVSDTVQSPPIEVIGPDTQWPADQTICVSSSSLPIAGQGGCPDGASTFLETDFNLALEDHCEVDDQPVRCLFQRGDVFEAFRHTLISNPGPSMVAAFGSGAKPRVENSGEPRLIKIEDEAADTRFVDLTLVNDLSDGSNHGAFYGSTVGRVFRTLILRVDILNYRQGLHFWVRSGSPPEPTHSNPPEDASNEIFVIDSTVLRGTGLQGNDVYLVANRAVFMGNRIADKLQSDWGEHGLRIKYAQKSIFAHNSFGLLDNSSPANFGCEARNGGAQGNLVMTVRSSMSVILKQSGLPPERAHGKENIIADNLISSCRQNAWDMTIGGTSSEASFAGENHFYYLIQGNHFITPYNEKKSGSGRSLTLSLAHYFRVRDNVIDATSNVSGLSRSGIAVSNKPDQIGEPGYIPSAEIRIHDNVFFQGNQPPDDRRFMRISGADHQSIRIFDNLLYDVSGEADVVVLFPDVEPASLDYCHGGELEDCNIDAESNPFVGPLVIPTDPNYEADYNMDQFRLTTSAPLIFTDGFESGDTTAWSEELRGGTSER